LLVGAIVRRGEVVMAAVVAELEVSTERLEAEVCTLAGQIAAATCRFVLLVAELDRRETWREWAVGTLDQIVNPNLN
jgi:hypothetical protein